MEEVDRYANLYSSDDKKVMHSAEEARDLKKDRVDEFINYANAHGIKNIGVANCIAFEKQTVELKAYLESKNFTVHTTNCKLGKIPSSLIVENSKGIACNPIGQAEYLEKKNTELNISFGLCIGHDILFNQHTKAPVTTMLVKDRKYAHKTIERFNKKNDPDRT